MSRNLPQFACILIYPHRNFWHGCNDHLPFAKWKCWWNLNTQYLRIGLFSWKGPSVQFSSVTQLFLTLWPQGHKDPAACQASLSITNSQSLLKLMSIELVMLSNHLILCRPLLLLPSIFPSIRVFSNESVLCFWWPKYWSFSFSNSPFNEYSGLISLRIDWLDLLAVQGTLKNLLQHHSSKASRVSLSQKGN